MPHLLITRLAQATALLGGCVLITLIAMICISILGRETGFGPVTGDFELVEAGIAVAVFSFLPLTQLTGAHAHVAVLTDSISARAGAVLRGVWSVVMAGAILLITWRLYAGMQDKLRYGETSFLIQFPLWWAYAACFAAACVACVVAVYCAARDLGGQGGA